MSKHDENKDLRLFSKVGKVNYGSKTLKASKSANIGIRMLGKIDYLTKYCGWHFVWDNSVAVYNYSSEDKPKSRELKKKNKEPKLTNKKNKR